GSLRHLRSLGQTQLLNHDAVMALNTANSNYSSIIDLFLDEESGLDSCFDFTIQHGLLPVLNIRYIRDLFNEEIVTTAINWLLESIDPSYPLLGVDAECGLHSVRVRLIQISTRNRCILLRIPLHPTVSTNGQANRIPLALINLLE